MRSRGRAVHQQLSGAEQPAPQAQPAESAFVQRPTYSTPDKNLRAAEQIDIELEDLEGDERRQQMRRMRELLAAAKEQQLVADCKTRSINRNCEADSGSKPMTECIAPEQTASPISA